MAIFVPTVQSEHIQLGLIDSSDPNLAVDNKPFNDLRAAGVIEMNPAGLDNLRQGGDVISVPALAEPADFARIDHTSAVALSPNTIAANVDVAITQWNKVVYEFQDSDRIRSGNDASVEYSRKVGGKIAKRGFVSLMSTAVGALDAVDYPTANCHVLDVFSGVMGAEVYPSLELLRQGKALLGDAAGRLTTAVMTSAAFQWLLRDLMLNYGAGSVLGDSAARSGLLGDLLGIRNWIVSDLVPTTSGGGGNQDKQNIFLFGPGALWYGFQAEPKIERQTNILLPSTREYMAISFTSVSHLRFVKTALSANPTDVELVAAASWDDAPYGTEHKRVLAVKIVCNGVAETA